jgi:hypothetical protein
MTEIDSALVHRAEQAVLGALLAGHDTAAVRDLRASHFTDPDHQALYLAVTAPDSGGMPRRLRSRLARLGSGRVRRMLAYASELRGLCPEPGHRWVYAAMLLEARNGRNGQPDAAAGEPRRRADADQRLAGAGEWLASAAAGGRRRRPATGQNGPADRRTEKLARELRPVVAALVLQGAGDRAARMGAAGSEPVREMEGDPGARRLRREDLQDAVLADLMRRPGDGKGLVARVPAEAFSPGPRRELYGFLSRAISAGIPVDPLITAWQANKREPGPAWQADTDGNGRESLTALALRLGEMTTVPGTAAVIARVLLADHECTRAFGPGWTSQPLTWQAASPGGSGQQPRPGPGMTPGMTPGPAPSERPASAARARQHAPAGPASVRRPQQDGGTGPVPRQA